MGIIEDFCFPLDFRRVCAAVKEKKNLEDLLPREILSTVFGVRNLALGELSGRDSVAAIIKAHEEGVFDALVPIVVHTGTEYGSPAFIKKNISLVRDKIGDVVSEPVVMHDFEFWWALNGRFVSGLSRKFGFYSPCLGCHLYLHAVRVPLALFCGAKYIVSGEREIHGSKEKINQLSFALDFYDKLTLLWNIRLVLPLRYVVSDSEMEDIIGGEGLCTHKDQFSCVFAGNYRRLNGGIDVDREAVRRYYSEFGFPVTKKILGALLKDPYVDTVGLVKESFR